ncbi:conjugal transfer protein TraG N-terminal domain-containing protein, partial [Escherichia coli]|nr:conjugal transfer protein TraG N-terminal domain-containing protein [Escherichia coli]
MVVNVGRVEVHRVGKVPAGLAMPSSLTTRFGPAMVASYEMIFTQPDSVTYSKTGMLFGADMVSKSTDFFSRNPKSAILSRDYVRYLVLGCFYYSQKQTLRGLTAPHYPPPFFFPPPPPPGASITTK